MRNFFESTILTKLYRKRGSDFDKCVPEILLESKKEVKESIEKSLKEKYKNLDELKTVLDDISFMCDLNCEAFYKMGVADGLNFSQEIETWIDD